MHKRIKLFTSLASLCLSLAVLCFGVYAAISVTYKVGGTVSYTLQDVFVEVQTKVYRSTLTTQTNAETLANNVTSFKTNGSLENTVATNYSHTATSYNSQTGEIQTPGGEFETTSDAIELNYGTFAQDNNLAYAFYIVAQITNYGQNEITVKVTNNVVDETELNSYVRSSGNINIAGKTTDAVVDRVVIGFALNDPTIGVDNIDFEISLNITPKQEEVSENITMTSNSQQALITSVNVQGQQSSTNTNVYSNAFSPVNLANVSLASKQTAQIDINLQNNTQANYLKAKLGYTANSNVKVDSTSVFLPKDAINSTTYTIYIKNVTDQEISLADLNLTITFEEVTNLLQYDSTNNYYYVEMGTIARETYNEYIRWKYFSEDCVTAWDKTELTDVDFVNLTNFKGSFTLETDTVSSVLAHIDEILGDSYSFELVDNFVSNADFLSNGCAYNTNYTKNTTDSNFYHTESGWESVYANDYATSTIRRYLNFTDEVVATQPNYVTATGSEFANSSENASYKSNMIKDFNIDTTNDIIYNKITQRNLSELYEKLDSQENNFQTLVDNNILNSDHLGSLKNVTSDNFYILSNKDVRTMYFNGESWPNTGNTDLGWTPAEFWTYSTFDDSNAYSLLLICSGTTGSWYPCYPCQGTIAARACFNIG